MKTIIFVYMFCLVAVACHEDEEDILEEKVLNELQERMKENPKEFEKGLENVIESIVLNELQGPSLYDDIEDISYDMDNDDEDGDDDDDGDNLFEQQDPWFLWSSRKKRKQSGAKKTKKITQPKKKQENRDGRMYEGRYPQNYGNGNSIMRGNHQYGRHGEYGQPSRYNPHNPSYVNWHGRTLINRYGNRHHMNNLGQYGRDRFIGRTPSMGRYGSRPTFESHHHSSMINPYERPYGQQRGGFVDNFLPAMGQMGRGFIDRYLDRYGRYGNTQHGRGSTSSGNSRRQGGVESSQKKKPEKTGMWSRLVSHGKTLFNTVKPVLPYLAKGLKFLIGKKKREIMERKREIMKQTKHDMMENKRNIISKDQQVRQKKNDDDDLTLEALNELQKLTGPELTKEFQQELKGMSESEIKQELLKELKYETMVENRREKMNSN